MDSNIKYNSIQLCVHGCTGTEPAETVLEFRNGSFIKVVPRNYVVAQGNKLYQLNVDAFEEEFAWTCGTDVDDSYADVSESEFMKILNVSNPQ